MKYEEALKEYMEKIAAWEWSLGPAEYATDTGFGWHRPVTDKLNRGGKWIGEQFSKRFSRSQPAPQLDSHFMSDMKGIGQWAGKHKLGLGVAGIGGLLAYNALKNKPNENSGY